jgi:hypothetical protein
MASIAMLVYQRVYSVYSINPLFIPYEPYPIVNGELPHYYPIMIFLDTPRYHVVFVKPPENTSIRG